LVLILEHYQNHNEELKEKKEYIHKTGYKLSSEKRKEYNKRYYEKNKDNVL
jgi:hypothetical protein